MWGQAVNSPQSGDSRSTLRFICGRPARLLEEEQVATPSCPACIQAVVFSATNQESLQVEESSLGKPLVVYNEQEHFFVAVGASSNLATPTKFCADEDPPVCWVFEIKSLTTMLTTTELWNKGFQSQTTSFNQPDKVTLAASAGAIMSKTGYRCSR